MDDYNDIIKDLPKGSAYAFADMAEDQDALLVAENPIEFDGKVEAAKATVYAKDKDGNVKKMGRQALKQARQAAQQGSQTMVRCRQK